MKSFIEIVKPEQAAAAKGFPTFEDVVKSGNPMEEGVGTSSKGLQDAIGKLHQLQLDLQNVQKSMLDARDKFLGIPKGDPERDPIAEELKSLNKKKADLEKNIKDAEAKLQSALDKEDVEDVDIDLI
jgi:hypothetical protein